MSVLNVVDPVGETSATRRNVLVGAIYGMWALIGGLLGAPAAVYLLFAPKAQKPDEWIDIGEVSRLDLDQPVEIAFRRIRADAWRIVSEKVTAWVVRTPDKGVVAFGPQCTHLGCAYHWEERRNQFICPCHNSLFSVEGKVIAGPAARPLDRYEVKIESGRVLLGGLRQTPEASV